MPEPSSDVSAVAFDGADNDKGKVPVLHFHQFTEVDGREGSGRRPLMQWWAEGLIEFKDLEVECLGMSLPKACERIAEWSLYEELFPKWYEEDTPAKFFRTLCVHGGKGEPKVREEELRV